MEELKVFKNSEFGELGIMELEGKMYFPASQCAKVLGYSNPRDAIRRHCEAEGVVKRDGVSCTTNQHGKQSKQVVRTNYIDEGNLYRLIVSSKLPTARRFEKWVFDEVLPSIRKTGGYGAPDLGEVITQTAVAVVAEVMKQLMPTLKRLVQQPQREVWIERSNMLEACDLSKRCKLETFPPEIVSQVDAMMVDMMQQQALNFSLIARFCTLHGYTISSPSVKTYYKRRFSVD